MAGVRGEDLRVNVDADVLRIRGVRRTPAVEGVRRLHQMEIAFGPFERRPDRRPLRSRGRERASRGRAARGEAAEAPARARRGGERMTEEHAKKPEDLRPAAPGGTEIAVGTGAGEEVREHSFECPPCSPCCRSRTRCSSRTCCRRCWSTPSAPRRLIDDVLVRPDRLMVCGRRAGRGLEGSPGPDDVHRVGTVMRIVKMLKFPDDSYRLLVQGVAPRPDRGVREQRAVPARPASTAIPETGDYESVEMTALVRNVAGQFASLVAESPRLSDELQVLAANLDDPSKLADLVAHHLDLDVAGKQQLLEQPDVGERLKLVLAQISKRARGPPDRERDPGEGAERDGPDPARLHAAPAARGDPARARRERGGRARHRGAARSASKRRACPRRP